MVLKPQGRDRQREREKETNHTAQIFKMIYVRYINDVNKNG